MRNQQEPERYEAPTVVVHPIAEIVAKKMFSVETVPSQEARKMVRRAALAAAERYDRDIKALEETIERLRGRPEAYHPVPLSKQCNCERCVERRTQP